MQFGVSQTSQTIQPQPTNFIKQQSRQIDISQCSIPNLNTEDKVDQIDDIIIQEQKDLFKCTRKITNDYQRCRLLAKKSIIDDLTNHTVQNIKERQGTIKKDIDTCHDIFRRNLLKNQKKPNSNSQLLKMLENAYNIMKVLREQELQKRQKQILDHSEVQSNQKYFVIKADYERKMKFKSVEDFTKYSHKILIAKVLSTKGYGINCIREYTDCFKYPISIRKNHYNTTTGAIVTQTLRKVEYFVKNICGKKIDPFYHQEIRLLFTPLQNYRQKLPLLQRNALQKILRITFNLSTVVISQDEILSLYVAIVRMCRNVNFTKADLKSYQENLQMSKINENIAQLKSQRLQNVVDQHAAQQSMSMGDTLSHYSFQNNEDFQNFLQTGIKVPKKITRAKVNSEKSEQTNNQDEIHQQSDLNDLGSVMNHLYEDNLSIFNDQTSSAQNTNNPRQKDHQLRESKQSNDIRISQFDSLLDSSIKDEQDYYFDDEDNVMNKSRTKINQQKSLSVSKLTQNENRQNGYKNVEIKARKHNKIDRSVQKLEVRDNMGIQKLKQEYEENQRQRKKKDYKLKKKSHHGQFYSDKLSQEKQRLPEMEKFIYSTRNQSQVEYILEQGTNNMQRRFETFSNEYEKRPHSQRREGQQQAEDEPQQEFDFNMFKI